MEHRTPHLIAGLRGDPRTRPPASLRLGWALTIAVCIWASLSSFAASIQATLDRETLALGETAILKVSVEGGSGRDTPRIPEVNGLRFTLSGNGMSFSFEGGRQSIVSELTYTVTASKVGTYTIGPISATLGGQRVQSEPLTLQVVQANDPKAARNDGLDQAAFLKLVLPEREVYVGETFVVELHLYAIGGRLQQAPQLIADGFTVGKLQEAGQQGNIRANNRIYTRARFLQSVTAARSGDLTLQIGNCILDIPVPRRGGFADPFDDVFGLRENRRFTLSTEPSALKVLPLPKLGVPQGFSGAVGDFELGVSATPTNLAAGDPITVRIEIRGKGNFDSVQIPEQAAWRGFRLYPPTSEIDSQDPTGITGKKKFEQIVSPDSADITSLPSFVFSFFHPESKSYKTLRSPAIPLHIEAGAAAPSLPTPNQPENAANPPKLELAPLKPHLGTAVFSPVLWASQPWFLPVTLAPPVLWIFFQIGFRLRQRRAADLEAQRRADLEKRIAKGLASLSDLANRGESEPFFATVFRTLQESVALRTGQAPASITEGSLDAELPRTGVTQETIEALHQLFQTCNQARYARVTRTADLNALRAQTAAVCSQLRPSP